MRNPQGLTADQYKKIKTLNVGISNDQCSICIKDYKRNELVNQLPCQHTCHISCLKDWIKINRSYPFCGYNINKGLAEQDPQQQKRAKMVSEYLEKQKKAREAQDLEDQN